MAARCSVRSKILVPDRRVTNQELLTDELDHLLGTSHFVACCGAKIRPKASDKSLPIAGTLTHSLALVSIQYSQKIQGVDTSAPGTCSISPEASQGVCGRPSNLRFIVNSCGDVVGPTVVERTMAATGEDISSYKNKTVFSEAWSYMATLDPDNIILAGDNVYVRSRQEVLLLSHAR